jgi:hypothetical protein
MSSQLSRDLATAHAVRDHTMPLHVTRHRALGFRSLCTRPRGHSGGRSPRSLPWGSCRPEIAVTAADGTTSDVCQQIAFLWLPQMDDSSPDAVVGRYSVLPSWSGGLRAWRRQHVGPCIDPAAQPDGGEFGEGPELRRRAAGGLVCVSRPHSSNLAATSLAVAHNTSLFYRSARCEPIS